MSRVLHLTLRQHHMLSALKMSPGIATKMGAVVVVGQTFQPETAVHLMAKGCISGGAGRVVLTALGEAVTRGEFCSPDGQK